MVLIVLNMIKLYASMMQIVVNPINLVLIHVLNCHLMRCWIIAQQIRINLKYY
jgi:hypothetical protein